MRVGSLFSGYGGLDLAVLSVFAGAELAWHCEWEDAPSRILEQHWPGVPAGWVTSPEIGLKRNDQLKACGNGVVPQQAELALRMLLQGLDF